MNPTIEAIELRADIKRTRSLLDAVAAPLQAKLKMLEEKLIILESPIKPGDRITWDFGHSGMKRTGP